MKTLGRLYELTKRNIKLFLKNKATVFFSFLAPILVFLLYTLFMNNVLNTSISEIIPEGSGVSPESIKSVTSAWMIAGIVSIACLTIGLNSTLVMVTDKEQRTINDFTASPLSPALLQLSYFLGAFILTFTLCFLVMCLGLIYLAAFTGLLFGFLEFLEMTGVLFLSCLSSVTFMLSVMSFFKSNAASAAFTGIFSAIAGFLTGAYLPAGMLPLGVQYAANLMPGSHATALMRSVLLKKSYAVLGESLSPETLKGLSGFFSFELNIFGAQIPAAIMYVYLAASAVVFAGLFLGINYLLKRGVKLRNKK